jgi:hypothetical protein
MDSPGVNVVTVRTSLAGVGAWVSVGFALFVVLALVVVGANAKDAMMTYTKGMIFCFIVFSFVYSLIFIAVSMPASCSDVSIPEVRDQRTASSAEATARQGGQTPEVKGQFRAAALARSFRLHSARKTFISARTPRSRGATPLYFFVIPVTVLLTAPWPTRP